MKNHNNLSSAFFQTNKTVSIFLFMFVLLFSLNIISCNSEDKTKNTETSLVEDTIIEAKPENKKIDKHYKKDELIIDGENIWIRNKAISGDVLMKLNTGDICKILDTGEEDQIRDMFDYWYKIEYNDTVGWVFGAQTNIKSREIHEVIPFKIFLEEFIQAYQNKHNDLEDFTHEQLSKIFLFNPGAFCAEYYSNDLKRELNNKIKTEHTFNRKPKGDFCEGYPKEESGFYYWTIKSTDLPTFPDMTDEELRTKKIVLSDKYTNNTFYKVQVITNEYHFSYLYFINIENTWYLICEDRCDCSA